MQFTPIDLSSWNRQQIFCYFSKMAPTGYSLTVKIDITEFHRRVKNAKIKFFPAFLWAATKSFNEQMEFKIAQKDDVIGYYDVLTPLYAEFHDDDKTFSLMWTEYNDNFKTFYKRFLENRELYSSNHGILSRPELPPPNAYTISCVPWISFEHFAVHSYDNKPYFFPSVEAGKFYEENGKIYLPLSITCHHATTDGWHVKCFLESFEQLINTFEYK